jgi:hypothetical protein
MTAAEDAGATAPASDAGATQPGQGGGTTGHDSGATKGGGSTGQDAGKTGSGSAPEGGTTVTTPPTTTTSTGLHVVGNHLVDNGTTVRLLGVNHSGTEFSCVQNNGFFDGPSDQTLVTPMLAWHVNTVRVPLNEDCWLGINGVSSSLGGSAYQTAIETYVKMIRSNGLYVIVDLHWNGPGSNLGTAQQPMADADHSPAFWTSVANAFKSDNGIVFDLYNEPYVSSWSCWLSGCSESGWNGISGTYPTAGMQSLVNAVRATGATNVLMLGGIAYSNDLTGWLANEPTDPLGQLAASFHEYNFNTCASQSCWTSQTAPVAAKVPVITGELGENDCDDTFVDQYMTWADTSGISYMGWTWNTWDCSSGPALISDYDGTATGLGAGIKSHLISVNP